MSKNVKFGRKCAAGMLLAVASCVQLADFGLETGPILGSGAPLQDGEVSLHVDGFAVPTVVDWNNNGKQDLMVGQFDDGKISVFLNRGSDAAPVFDGGFFVQCAGKDIATSFG